MTYQVGQAMYHLVLGIMLTLA